MLYLFNKLFFDRPIPVLFSRLTLLIALLTIVFSSETTIKSQNLPSPSNTIYRDGGLNTSFVPVLSQTRYSPGVNHTFPLPNGKILVAGGFKVVNGTVKVTLARINNDGTLDNSFGVTASGSNLGASTTTINQVLVQPDGKILIGGSFKTINNIAASNFARLNEDGTLDTTFNIGSGFNNYVAAIALQQDGKILVGGDFSAFNGVNRTHLARLNTDGSLDTSFNTTIRTGWANTMHSILPLADGKIFIQGKFNSVDSVQRRGLAKLNADGTIDASFVEPANYSRFNWMYDFAVRPDGKIYIGGFFEISANNQLVCQNLCRLNGDGTVDTSYLVSFETNSSINLMSLQTDGRLLVHGHFEKINSVPRKGTARLNDDGSIDNSFNPNFSIGSPYSENTGALKTITQLTDGRYILGGEFNSVNGTILENLARIDNNGNLDTTFTPSFSSFGTAVVSAIQPDGKILIAGNFNRANGVLRGRIARFNANGTIDQSFNATISNGFPGTIYFEDVNKIVVQPDGKIIIGGAFAQVNGEKHLFLARLNSDGSVDSSFNPILTYKGSGGGDIFSITLQPDGKIIVGGSFQTVNGVAQRGYARLNADGTLDSNFVIPFQDLYAPSVNAVLIQPNGKLLIGGYFRFTGNSTNSSVAQLNPDGSLDTSFTLPSDPTATPYLVWSLARQPDGKILVGGTWTFSNSQILIRLNPDGTRDTTFNPGRIGGGYDSDRIYSIIVQPNGKILIGGNFSTINNNLRFNVARLIENGGLDFSFNAPQFTSDSVSYPTSLVQSVNQTSDGNLIVAGYFDRIGNIPVSGFAQLQVKNITRQPLFDFDGDGKDDQAVFRSSNSVWYLLRSASGFSANKFGVSTDRIAPADFDGDARTDIVVFRDGIWHILKSSNGEYSGIQFGLPNDIPQPADYDGDGKSDLAVFRPSNSTWYIMGSRDGFNSVQWGNSSDKPVVADYDGDGKSDLAVFRPENGVWYILQSRDGFTYQQFGLSNDKPVPADYDGDRKTDYAVYRPSAGTWYILKSSQGFASTQFGVSTDQPAPADYDGDGKVDIALVRDGVWYMLQSTNGFSAVQFGQQNDQPISTAFIQ